MLKIRLSKFQVLTLLVNVKQQTMKIIYVVLPYPVGSHPFEVVRKAICSSYKQKFFDIK